MTLTHQRRATTSAALFAFAGMAFLVTAVLDRGARDLVMSMRAVAATLFFLAAYLQYRRSRRGSPAHGGDGGAGAP
jgi:threonine/homoserine efflux transporter RhtA